MTVTRQFPLHEVRMHTTPRDISQIRQMGQQITSVVCRENRFDGSDLIRLLLFAFCRSALHGKLRYRNRETYGTTRSHPHDQPALLIL